ncbi:MAG: dTDP-4-amino-4,6-dideoxygalactose transaminase [Gemmataceae bacterium]|nr:dTDP-4-amino-4,6-dideoxygalactose transaminase [Gemmataceae bacterium]
MAAPIAFNRPAMPPAAYDYLRQAVGNMHLSGDGPFTKRCHAVLEQVLGAPKVLLTTSCTHALEMAALLLDIGPGDEVIVPSFTFVSTANAFALRGARPVFADIRPDTLNLDERPLPALLTARTRAVVPVHYAGVGCEMGAIGRVCRAAGVAVVEDNAHGLFGAYRDRPLGGFGRLAAQSFHETKNVSCGEGGALVINDPELADRAEILREKGTDRSRFFRGQVDKYTWVDVGSSYLPSDALAALLLAQLETREAIQAKRRAVWDRYARELADWATVNRVGLPHVPAHCDHPAHLFYLLLPTLDDRQRLLAHLKSAGITATFHYVPLHLSAMGRRFGGRPGLCPVAEAASDRLVRLPLFFDLTDAEQGRVIDSVKDFRVRAGAAPAADLLTRLAYPGATAA